MAPLRVIDPTGLYHVFSRGNYRAPIFLDLDHYEKYLSLLERVARRRRWVVLDWCLLPNHYHVLVRLQNAGLSEGMRELNGCFSRWSNFRTSRTGTGHFVKNRFGCVDVLRDGHLWSLLSYLPLNPVRAELVEQPEDWPWSGYRATVGIEHVRPFHRPAELLRLFGKNRRQAIERYTSLVQTALVQDGGAEWSDHEPSPANVVRS